jgi:hypothetical protein
VSTKQFYYYRDDLGQLSYTWLFVDSAADAANLRPAVDALLTAAFQGARGPYTTLQDSSVRGSGGYYPSIHDKAVMYFLDTHLSAHMYYLPAPRLAIFENDGESVALLQADVQNYITAMLLYARTAAGDHLDTFYLGQHMAVPPYRHRQPR